MKTMIVFSKEDFEALSALLQNAICDAETLEKDQSQLPNQQTDRHTVQSETVPEGGQRQWR